MALTDKLTAIGNAIRAKTGGSDLLTLDEMPQEIQSIQTGGGGDTALADSILSGTVTSYSSDTLVIFKEYSFTGCEELTSLICPNVTALGKYCFYGCGQLSTVTIKWEQVPKLPDYGFKDCKLVNNPPA